LLDPIRRVLLAGLIAIACAGDALAQMNDPLPSWNDGAAKTAIIDFVARVTTPGSPDFVPVNERVAAFDNDGTMWTEQPIYPQAVFTYEHIQTLAAQHPEWKDREPLKTLAGLDIMALTKLGQGTFLAAVEASDAPATVENIATTVIAWIETARHPRFGRLYTELAYQPMLELLAYLRANNFKTYIVSGGNTEFMRTWTEKTYGIPPEQVVGSFGAEKFLIGADGEPMVVKLPTMDFNDNGPGKVIGIERAVGRRPIFIFGNGDNDLQMLQWTAGRDGAHFVGLVHHTDAEREYAYDRDSVIGRLDKALDEAIAKNWTIVDMKQDWKVVYPFQK
jgi:phosphoglycolate phosphatase-like HAD superfamily hydrolase